ncbi:MAG: DUF1722 domain-containing protein [Planctomycetota bacterium]
MAWSRAELPLRLGVSACLLGDEVRWNGGHARSAFVARDLARFAELEAFCPELELGLGVPRPTIRLERDAGGEVRLVEPGSGADLGPAMDRLAGRRVGELLARGLAGVVVKKDSPSCGLERVKVWDGAQPRRDGRGRFTAALVAAAPLLPIEEEGRLQDPVLREHWVERVWALHRLQGLLRSAWGVGDLVAFHTAHKLQLRAHSPAWYRALGRLVAGAAGRPRVELADAYAEGFQACLATHARIPHNVDALQHLAGFLKRRLDAAARRELHDLIHDYRHRLVPLSVPLALCRHHVRAQDLGYLAAQSFLEPYPKELLLRHHVQVA